MNEHAEFHRDDGTSSRPTREPPETPKTPGNTKVRSRTPAVNPRFSIAREGNGTAASKHRRNSGRVPVLRSVLSVSSAVPSGEPGNRTERYPARQQGFTLIEVLIALAVLTICMSALIQAGGTRADHVGYLRDRTLAHWIATDRVTEFRLAEDWPAAGTQEGETEMAGRTWSWQAEISETPDSAVRRVEVAVGIGEDGEPLSRVVGFLGDPEDRVR